MIKKVLLSGGWGYGNLGDDALLEASINILKEIYPEAEITIMSYDHNATKLDSFKVVTSLHRAIYRERAFKFLRVYGKSWNYDSYPSIVARIINKVDRLIEPLRSKSDDLLKAFLANNVVVHKYKEIFEKADIFVMSGGGYFNNWEDSFNSRYAELIFAKETGTPVYIIGQTTGPLSEKKSEIIRPLLHTVKAIYVRDVQSEKDLVAMGCNPLVAPDLALSYVGKGEFRESICVIPAEYPTAVRQELIEALVLIAQKKRLPIILTATRLYNRDINCLREIYKALAKSDVPVRMLIPSNYEEVKQTIKGNRYVISRNLHGLILGWREGAKCLCLCGERKFVSFMKQTGREDCIVDVNSAKAKDILTMFEHLEQIEEDHLGKQQSIAKDVWSACRKILVSK